MCGILIVKSEQKLDHVPALDILRRRGPDYINTKQIGDVFIAQSVLHITGTPDFYFQDRLDGFAYNGEIYNYRLFGNYSNDVELAYHTAKNNPTKFKEFEGPWAWGHVTENNIQYACDPQGEHRLYHFKSNELFIVCSEISPILHYIDDCLDLPIYQNKAWTMLRQTPWRGIERCEPGMLYQNGIAVKQIDTIFDWCAAPTINTLGEAVEEFTSLWRSVIKDMTPKQQPVISYSGGIDSTLISVSLSDPVLLSIDIVDKDPIVDNLTNAKVRVTAEEWANHCKDIIKTTMMPLQCWSDVGKWLIAKHAPSPVIFTGVGADELFGGYDVYKHIKYDTTKCYSTYSEHDHDNLWEKCLSSSSDDPRAATLLMDYWYEVIGVDAATTDRLYGFWGREARNPFMHPRVIKFALSLPWHLRVGNETKVILREFYQQLICTPIEPKRGFAGHANDSLPWLGVDIIPTGDRHEDWKLIIEAATNQLLR